MLCLNIDAQIKVISLDELKWKNRILLVFSNDETVNSSIQEELIREKAEVDNRDIIYFIFTPKDVISNSDYTLSAETKSESQQKFFKEKDNPKIILIGKDGGVKINQSQLNLDEIFRRIDSMPMRIREMQNQN